MSLANVFDFERFESLFTKIEDRLDIIDGRLTKIEEASKIKDPRIPLLRADLDPLLNLPNRCRKIEEKWNAEFPPVGRFIEENSKLIDALREDVGRSQITEKETRDAIREVDSKLSNWTQSLENKFVDKLSFAKLGETQANLNTSLCALQNLLSCKIDRAEVPIIENCARQVEQLTEICEKMRDRVHLLEGQIEEFQQGQKDLLKQEVFDTKVHNIDQTLLRKVDATYLEASIAGPLEVLQNLEPLNKVMREKGPKIDELMKNVEVLTEVSELTSAALKRFKTGSQTTLDSKADIVLVEQLVAEVKNRISGAENWTKKEFAGIRSQLKTIVVAANTQAEQIKVLMKFVDWYSSSVEKY